MIQFYNTEIKNISVHFVGNKNLNEDLTLSNESAKLNEETSNLLLNYFIKPFQDKENLSHFFHNNELHFNEVYSYISEIFSSPDNLHSHSRMLATHLYEQSLHPKIKGGEFYTVYFSGCIIDGVTCDAIGLFKSENKDTFLKIYPYENSYSIDRIDGININKLDKGCLIFNMEKEIGYIVSVVDNSNRGIEAQYWVNDFLQIKPRNDEYYNTEKMLSLCKNFATKELPQQFEVTKADQVDFLNKSVKFFKEKDNFDIDDFENEVIGNSQVIESFKKYKNHFQDESNIEFSDNFTISESAVKKQARILKSVIKLDKNFHIYVHGNNQFIQKGYDEETGLHFYKLFFKEEE